MHPFFSVVAELAHINNLLAVPVLFQGGITLPDLTV